MSRWYEEHKEYVSSYGKLYREVRKDEKKAYNKALREGEIAMFGKTHNRLFRRMFNA